MLCSRNRRLFAAANGRPKRMDLGSPRHRITIVAADCHTFGGIARGLLLDPLPYANEREVGVFWKKTDWTEDEFLFLQGLEPGADFLAAFLVVSPASSRSFGGAAKRLPDFSARRVPR
jgi:hypothetical protein